MSLANKPADWPAVRFEWITESWRCFSAALGAWIASLTVVGILNIAAFLVAFSAFGVESRVKAIAQSALQSASQQLAISNVSALSATVDQVSRQLGSLDRMPGYRLTLLATTAVAAFLYAGLQRMANAQLRSEPISADMIFSGAPVFGSYFAYTLIASIPNFVSQVVHGIGVGFIFVHIVSIVVYVLAAPGYAAVADGAPASEAIHASFAAVWPNLGMGLLLFIVFSIVCLISAIPCLLGLTVTTPMITIMFSLAYRDLIGMRGAGADSSR